MDSPLTSSRNSWPSPTSCRGSGNMSSIRSSARIGPPAAIRPTTGTLVGIGAESPKPVSSYDVSDAEPIDLRAHRLGQDDLEGTGEAGVLLEEALLLQHPELVGDARSARQTDGLADLPHARRIAALVDAVLDVLQHPLLPRREPGCVRRPVGQFGDLLVRHVLDGNADPALISHLFEPACRDTPSNKVSNKSLNRSNK